MSWSYSEMYLPPAKPLPFNPYNLSSEPEWYNAYQWCLQIEPHCLNDKGQDLVYARILGYLILKAPTSEGRNYISNEILSCDKAELYELAEVFLSGVLTLFKQTCCSEENEATEQLGAGFFMRPAGPIERVPRDHGSAKLSALRRDDYKCIVSRVSDWDYLVFHTAEWGDVRATKSYAWHIIPPLSNPELDPTSAFIINYFALSPEELSDLPHSLENTLTLACIVSPAIQELFTWFEADPSEENTYCPRSWRSNYLGEFPKRVTFSTKTGLPLPKPLYLKMHMAICEIAILSGASKRKYYLRYLENKNEGEEEDSD